MKVSKTGYKKNSKDKNQPSLLIPSNRITMKGVEFPVLGTDNYGNQQMMYPGQEYSFPGDYVIEKPMKNWLNKYQEGGEPKPMSWTEYLDSLGITDPKLRNIDPRTKLYSNETHEIGKGSDLSYDNYMNAAMERPHTSNVFEDADNLKAGRVIDMYNALFWNREKQDYSGSDRNKYDDELPSNKVDIELSPYADHSMDKKDALAYIKKLYNTPTEDIISESFDKEAPGFYSRAFKDIPIEYTRSFPRVDLTMYNNPNWERDNPLFSRDKSIEVFGQYDSMPLTQNFDEEWTYNDPKAFNKDKQSLEFQAFPKPTYNYVNVPKRYDEKGNEVVSKYDIPNPQGNTYYDFPGSLTEDIYNQKNMLHNIYKENVENLKKFDPSASLKPSDRDLRREYIEKEYASDPYLFYGDQNTEDRYCVHCERLSGSEHTKSGNIDFFKFKPQYPSSKEWIQSQKPRVDREIIQVRNTPNPTHRTWSQAVQDKNPGMGTQEYATTVRIGTDMYPVTHTTDKPYGEFEVDGKKQYITYEKNPEGGYNPVISETKPATPKVIKAPTFKSGGWLDTYDTMTPAWSKNPEGNWVVKAQNGLQYIDEPTRADSLELLNNSRMVLNYYKSKGYDAAPPIYLKNEADKKDIQEATESARKYYDPNKERQTPAGIDAKVPLKDYYKKKDKNKYYQREYANSILDTRSPMVLYDKRILPTVEMGYMNDIPGDVMMGDMVSIGAYDPLSITPWDMLTDKQKKLRVKRFGRDSVPESYDPDRPAIPENIKPLPIKLLPLQGPEDRLIKEYDVIVPNEKYRKVYDKSPYSTKEFGPEGKFTHWAKEDEKLSGIWRPIKGTPSDLFVTKKVKYQKGGVHQKVYRNAEEFAKANKAYNDSLIGFNKFPIGSHFALNLSRSEFLKENNPATSRFPGISNLNFANSLSILPANIEPTVNGPYSAWEWVYKKPTEEPVYEELKNLTPLDVKLIPFEPKLDIGKPAVKSQGIRIRPMMTADQNTTTGQYQSGKYIWDPNTKSWKVQMFSPETQQENKEEVKLKSKKNGGWLNKYQGVNEPSQVERRDPNQPFFPSATEQDMYESQYSQPEVTITPDWTEAELERNRLRDEYIKKDKNIFRHWYDKLGYDKDNVTKRANQHAYNKLAKEYLKGDREKLTPEQIKFIEKSEYANRLQPSVGSRFVEGVTNPGFNMETVTNILAPFEYPSNLVRGAVTGEFVDAVKGQTPSPYFVSSDLAGTSPTEAAIASGLMTVGTDPLFLAGDEVLSGVGKGARGLRKFLNKPTAPPKVTQPTVLPTGPSKSLDDIAADVDALNATIKPRSEATTEDMQSLLERLQDIRKSMEEHIDPSEIDDLDDMSFDPSITDDIDSVDPDLFKSMKDQFKGLDRDIKNDELARDREMDKILDKEVPEEFMIQARVAGEKGPEQTGYFSETEINQMLAQYQDYLEKRKYFDDMFPDEEPDIISDIFGGGDKLKEREQMFENLFPNIKKPNWWGKEYRPEDRAYLANKLKYEPDTPFHKFNDKTSEIGLKGLLNFEKQTNTQLPVQKYISQVEQEMSDPASWYNTNPKDFVMEFRGQLDLDPKRINSLSEQELRELAEDIQIARIRAWKESLREQLNQKGPKPDITLPRERLNKYGGSIKWLDKYQDGGSRDMPLGLPLREQNVYLLPEYNQPMANGYILPDPNRPELLNTGATEYKYSYGMDNRDVQVPSVVAGQYIGDNAFDRYMMSGEQFKPMPDPSSYSKFYNTVNELGLMKQKKGGVKSSAEGYYDYINGYSGIFANGGTKGWLDNYK